MMPSASRSGGGLRSVPRMATRCLDTGTVSSAGVRAPGAEFVSSQWKEALKWAQQAPHDRHGFDIHAEAAPVRLKKMRDVAPEPGIAQQESVAGRFGKPFLPGRIFG